MILYEINSRLDNFQFTKLSTEQLTTFKKKFHFDAIWLMGVWELSPLGIELSRQYAPDFQGSPYAIFDYQFNKNLGDEQSFKKLRETANSLGIKIILDFVPNHMALDTPLIDLHPEFFIHSNPSLRTEYELDYFIHPSGKKLAHGKDPHFAGWTDTVQLNYTNKELRNYMCKIIEKLASISDGIRCDMAMLILQNQIKKQWFTNMSEEEFISLMPNEFWDEAISAAHRINPDFIFIAEVYWNTETQLKKLGFNYTYNKRLYDALTSDEPATNTNQHLQGISSEFLHHSVNFIENHDEERVATKLSKIAGQRAATLISLLPGMPLIHQGQMQGISEKLPVQRTKLTSSYVPDTKLEKFYQELLSIAAEPIFRQGNWVFAKSNWETGICFWRFLENEIALIGIQQGEDKLILPEVLDIDFPAKNLTLIKTNQCRSGWDKNISISFLKEKTFILIKRKEALKCINNLEILYFQFSGSGSDKSANT